MNDQIDDDEFPEVKISLRNTDGNDQTIELRQHLLGHEPHILITPDEGAISLVASHFNLDEVVHSLGYIVGAMLQSEEVSAETKENVLEFVESSAAE